MFAMDHAATALVLKRRYPRVPMAALLASVQLPELVWVFLNVFGIERTTTEAHVHTVADIHLAYMPYSHSVTTVVGAALLAAGVLWAVTRRRDLAVAVGLGMASHLVLDLITHAPDLMLAPGVPAPRLGLGLYPAAPWAAFLLELAYGVVCWRIYRGTYALLATVLLFNAANVSMFSTALPGPEELLPAMPKLLPILILAQIVITLVLTGLFARRPATSTISQRARRLSGWLPGEPGRKAGTRGAGATGAGPPRLPAAS